MNLSENPGGSGGLFRPPTYVFPPHPGARIAIKGDAWVSGWHPAATELTILKKAYSSQKNSLVVRRF